MAAEAVRNAGVKLLMLGLINCLPDLLFNPRRVTPQLEDSVKLNHLLFYF
jgi:hypothetical protein